MPKSSPHSETKDNHYWLHREEILAKRKKYYQENEAYREATRRRARERYHQDPAYQQATYRRALARYYQNKQRQVEEQSENQND